MIELGKTDVKRSAGLDEPAITGKKIRTRGRRVCGRASMTYRHIDNVLQNRRKPFTDNLSRREACGTGPADKHLHNCLLKPFMSSEDISKGDRWSASIATQLSSTDFGIICVTSENLRAPWLMFESGAISKAAGVARVAPILFGPQNSDLTGSPLIQFQTTTFSEVDIEKLILSINAASSDTEIISESLVRKSFLRGWDELKKSITDTLEAPLIGPGCEVTTLPNNVERMATAVEELLANSRNQMKLLSAPDVLFPRVYMRDLVREISVGQLFVAKDHYAWQDVDAGLTILKQLISEKLTARSMKPTSETGSLPTPVFNDDVPRLSEAQGRLEKAINFIRSKLYGNERPF